MCNHDDSVEEHALQLDHARGVFVCIAHPPAPIPRQRDDELDRIVPAMQGEDAGARYLRRLRETSVNPILLDAVTQVERQADA